MFWLAMISSLTAKSGDEKKEVDSKIITDKKLNFGKIFLVFVSIFIFIFIFNIRNASANQKNLLAIRNLSSGFSSGNLEVMDSLSFSSPHIDDTRSNIGRAALDFLSANWQKLDKTKVNNLFDLVIQNLEKNLLIHPLDIRNQLLLSQIYQLQTIVNNNPVYLLKMENVLQDALSKSPKRQQIIYSLSAVQMQLNKKDSAIKLLEQTILDNPNVSESYWRLAYIYKLAGQEEKAKKIIDQGVNYGVRFTDQDKKIINDNIINGYIFK
jgi:tetratricopeptide (TPR) repeat protein